MQLSNEIEAVYEIVENPRDSLKEEFPFMVVCRRQEYAPMGWPCKTLAEAEILINQIAMRAFKNGHDLKAV